jgi:hypothetical protein
VRALLAPIGITTTTSASPVTVVCGSQEEKRAAIDEARAQGASTVIDADEITDILAFGDQVMTALGVA